MWDLSGKVNMFVGLVLLYVFIKFVKPGPEIDIILGVVFSVITSI